MSEIARRRPVRRALVAACVNPRFHRLLGRRGEAALLRLAYLARYSRWLDGQRLEPRFAKRADFFEHLYESERLERPIDYLEFGVFTGKAIRWWTERVRHPDARFVGFDTFEGLPERWGRRQVGAYSTAGQVPKIDDPRCGFEIGMFQDTLPGFLRREPLGRRLVVHLDADLYSSTLFVLTTLHARLQAGDLLLFDEIGSLRHPMEEFRAFEDFANAYRLEYRALVATREFRKVAIRVGG
jgi:hypothetical protein